MSIIRTSHNKENPYVMLNKTPLEDPNLSWGAKGLWSYLISRPDNWNVEVAHLKKLYKGKGGGEKAIYSYLNELIDAGYCEREKPKNEKGRFEKIDYTVLEFKKIVPHSPARRVVKGKVVTQNPHIYTNKEEEEEGKKKTAAAAFENLEKLSLKLHEEDGLIVSPFALKKAITKYGVNICKKVILKLTKEKPSPRDKSAIFTSMCKDIS
jgi:hypothetical protein